MFDFWNQEFLGIFKESVELNIEPHDTHVLHIRPLLQRPQILATDRHISGAYSIETLKWDAEKLILSGSSKTVAGTPYSLFVHVPGKFSLSKIKSNAKAVPEKINDHVLKITMKENDEITNWSIIFKD